MADLYGLQLETIEAIIVALGTSFVGTGTVALIVKVALSKVSKSMVDKVKQAEIQNEISSKQAEQNIKNINLIQNGLVAQIDTLQETVQKLIDDQNITNRSVQSLLDEYKSRDEEIKDIIIQEFGDDIE